MSKDEKKAVQALEELARNWPESLWLFSASGRLHVLRKDSRGRRAMTKSGGVDEAMVVATIDIESDGGDW